MEIMTAEAVKQYTLRVDNNGNVIGEYGQDQDPGVEVDRLCREYAAAFKCSYAEAFQSVMTDPDNLDVVRAYAMS